MLSKIGLTAFALVAFVRVASAQQPVWAQCGGIGWTGETTCVSGTTCTVLNDWYSQCIPGSASSSVPTTTSTTTAPTSVPSGVDKANFWFSFGDSYTQTDFDPNGILPQPGNPLGNPPYPGYTAVGGVNWIDLDTVVYNNSLILTYNYAYGGATINASLVAPYEPTVLSLIDQVNQFLAGAANKPATAPWTSENALFSVWIGINDLGNSYYEPGDRDAFSDTLLDSYFGQIQELFNVGARNFLFINVPPTDRSPLMIGQGATAQALLKQTIAGYNSKLAARAASFQAANPGVQTWVWDSNAAFTTVLDDPTAYGFVDATSYGNPGDFWGNNLHPSSAAHDIWARGVAAVLNNTVW
ncbi:carbohydrate esterase family 16 protein [Trametes coccinea BRFM310]|uniref:Carbohydrate esterase family 16 protein n=1 Tax=Trametes coccinea (strain BRFM310) TaxID=1353009 RepID=A0A1Y2IDC3_TRAC3|nr:carbohydrate esterase family 16 protein [Trametes coccinea BRFM310]